MVHMKHEELTWRTWDETEIYVQSWEPQDSPLKAVVCLVHGLGEHSSRYAHVAQAICRKGYALFGMDLRGHGRSGGPRGHIRSIEDYLKDIDILMDQARSRFGDRPLILYGHSLGGILVLHHILKRKPDVAGVVATGPGLHTSLEEQPAKMVLVRVLGSILPGVTMPSGLDPKSISRDPNVVRAYVADPLVHDKISLGFGRTMLDVIRWTLEHAAEFSRPLLLMHGASDVLAYPSSSKEFAEALKGKCELRLWDGAFHELHNEPEQAQVFETMTRWMDTCLQK